jgi:hypothetical protein
MDVTRSTRSPTHPTGSQAIGNGHMQARCAIWQLPMVSLPHPIGSTWGSFQGSTHLSRAAHHTTSSTPTAVPRVPKVPGEGAALAWRVRGDGGAIAPPLCSNQCGRHFEPFCRVHNCPNAVSGTAAQLQMAPCCTLSLPLHASSAGARRLLARSASDSTPLQGSTRSLQAAVHPTSTLPSRCTAYESALPRAFLAAQQPPCTQCALARAQREPQRLSDRRGATLCRHGALHRRYSSTTFAGNGNRQT